MKFSYLSFLFLMVFLAGCNKVLLLQELNQNDTNEILVLLAHNGISATKKAVEKQQATTWTIEISPGDEQKARQLLMDNHLPKLRELGFAGVCKDAGLIPTPQTEKCRQLLAIKGEIINSLESIPGVVNADVVLNLPDKQDFVDPNVPTQRPAASVVIQVSEELANPEVINESKVQQFVANAVTGMDMRDVAVIISGYKIPTIGESNVPLIATATAETPTPTATTNEVLDSESEDLISVGGLTLEAESAKRFKLFLVLFLIVFILMAIGLIVLLLRTAKLRQQSGGLTSYNPALPEKAAMNQLVDETREAQK